MAEIPERAVRGPIVRSANPVIGVGIHGDEAAKAAGFRGGTVPGSIHLDHFPPVLVDTHGSTWFERGVLSMYFRQPTTHLEPVQVVHDLGDGLADAWIVTPEGAVVAEGACGLLPYPAPTPLRTRDRRPVDASELDLLHDVPIGERLDVGSTRIRIDRQVELFADSDVWPDPFAWYVGESPWGPQVACPSVLVDALWTPFQNALRPFVKPAIGLYGAIEIHHRGRPILAGVDYQVSGVVTEVSRSPKTEILWGESTAHLAGEPIASVVMMIRLLS